jgi:hypothetical protein
MITFQDLQHLHKIFTSHNSIVDELQEVKQKSL